MILSYSQYREILEEDSTNEDVNYEFEVLQNVIAGLYENDYLNENDLLQLFANIGEELEIEYDEELTLDEWLEYFSTFITEGTTEENERVFHLTDECKELYEIDISEAAPASGIHQTARNLRGAYDAITGAETPRKWYDTITRTGAGMFKNYNKEKSKQAKYNYKADLRKEKQQYKIAKLQAKHGLPPQGY